jgi:acetyl-CoA carboxylase biotin carboxyl carrier protein
MALTKKTADSKKVDDALSDLESIKEFIQFFDKSGISEIEISSGDVSLYLSKNGHPVQAMVQPATPHTATHAPAVAPGVPVHAAALAAKPESVEKPKAGKGLVEVKSPIVGTFYRTPKPGAPAFVDVGTAITQGKVLCIIEAMKVMNEIESEINGIVKEICVANEQPVEFGQVLFLVEPK